MPTHTVKERKKVTTKIKKVVAKVKAMKPKKKSK